VHKLGDRYAITRPTTVTTVANIRQGLSERISLRFVALVAEHPGRNLDAEAASAVVGASASPPNDIMRVRDPDTARPS
jgi:hypothetical protein